MAALEVAGINKSFGGVHALSDVTMSLTAQRITGIIGPNGAGKSTLVNVVSGLNKADGGRIDFEGREVSRLSISARSRLGIVRTFQHPHYFGSLPVSEVIGTGLLAPANSGSKPTADEVLERFDLGRFADDDCSKLPYGTKKLVNVAFAWALQPKVLFLDEPFAGVGDEYAEAFSTAIRQLAADGVAVGLIEHNIELVMALSDDIVVLDAGAVIFAGTPAEAARDRGVAEAFFGRRATRLAADEESR